MDSSNISPYNSPPPPPPPPPAPAPAPDVCGYLTDLLTQIEILVCILACLLPFLAIFGSTRRHNGYFGFINAFVRMAYIGSSSIISIALGNMQAFEQKEAYFTFWAVFLLLALGCSDSIPVLRIEESETLSDYLEYFRADGIWVLFMICYTWGLSTSYKVEVVALWVLALVKVYERAFVMRFTTIPTGVARVARPIVDSNKNDPQEVEPDRYNYMVSAKVTFQNIWDCKGELLDVKSEDICLSFAWYKILRCRFAGYSLPEYRAHPKTWRFFRDRLLAKSDDYEKPFRVIETELAFLYDFFYTKYPIVTRLWYLVTIRAFEMIIISVACLGALKNLKPEKFSPDSCILIFFTTKKAYNIDKIVTWFVIGTIIFTELVQLFYIFFSDWMKLRCLCAYVQYPFLQKNKCIDYMIKILGCIPWPKWQRRLGQYTLLECFNSHRYSSVITKYMKGENTKGRKKKSIKLLAEVKEAIVKALERLYDDSGYLRLTKGTTSLRENNVEILGWACDDLLPITEVVLVWHVATSLCEMELQKKAKEEALPRKIKGNEQFLVATSLSKYCAYLVAFLPRLLPGYPLDAVLILDEVIDEARKELKGCNGCNPLPERFEKMMKLDKGETVLGRGARLGSQLLGRDDRWKILADFWAELLLFLAPSDVDIIPHALQLAEGGEFITHLWALLFHAGVNCRDSLPR